MKTIKPIIVLIFALSCMSASAQKFGKTPQDSIDCVRNLSLYSEAFKQNDYDNAFEPWLQVYRVCPGNHPNTFLRGQTILRYKIAREKDPEKRQEFIDLLLETFDKRDEYFPLRDAPGFIISRKAFEIRTLFPPQPGRPAEGQQRNTGRVNEAYRLMERAVEMGVGDDHVAPFYLFELAMANERAGYIDKEEVLEAYDIASSYLEKILKSKPGDSMILNTLANLDIAFEPYATCDEIIPILEKKYDENKGDVAFLEKVTKILDHKDCNDSELFFKATEALHALKPDPKTAYLMASMLNEKKIHSGVIDYLKDNADKLENNRDRARAFLLLINAYYNEARYREGRTAAQKALEINPNDGLPYIFIAMMYAHSAKDCGDEPQVSQRAAWWAAVDKLREARRVDSNRTKQIDDMIMQYSQQFPSGDDLFFHGIQEGSTYTVGCWIQERTTVRKRP
jgi:tetratricopeptide (TPR) repeat protein